MLSLMKILRSNSKSNGNLTFKDHCFSKKGSNHQSGRPPFQVPSGSGRGSQRPQEDAFIARVPDEFQCLKICVDREVGFEMPLGSSVLGFLCN